MMRALIKLVSEISALKEFCFDTETTSLNALDSDWSQFLFLEERRGISYSFS